MGRFNKDNNVAISLTLRNKTETSRTFQEPMPLRGLKGYTNIPSSKAWRLRVPFRPLPLSDSANPQSSMVLGPLRVNRHATIPSTTLHPSSTAQESWRGPIVPLSTQHPSRLAPGFTRRAEMQAAAACAMNKKYPEKHLPVPPHTFKNPESAKARRRRELADGKKKMTAEELTAMVRRSAREHASAAKALRMRIAASRQRKARLVASSDKENERVDESDDDDVGSDYTNDTEEEHNDWNGAPCTMPIFGRAERPSPKIVLTDPDGDVQSIQGKGYCG